MFRVALHAVVFCLLMTRGVAAPDGMRALGSGSARELRQPQTAGCGDCRVTFMKCMVEGKDLPPDERKEHNARCAAVAAQCYKQCAN